MLTGYHATVFSVISKAMDWFKLSRNNEYRISPVPFRSWQCMVYIPHLIIPVASFGACYGYILHNTRSHTPSHPQYTSVTIVSDLMFSLTQKQTHIQVTQFKCRYRQLNKVGTGNPSLLVSTQLRRRQVHTYCKHTRRRNNR